MKKFVAMGPVDIDDLSINRITTTRIINVQKLTFISATGAESDECGVYTQKAKIICQLSLDKKSFLITNLKNIYTTHTNLPAVQ